MTESLPPAGYAADVPRPPMRFSIDVPDHWTVVDLDPQTGDVWLDAFLDQRFRPETGVDRAALREDLSRALQQLYREKVFMAALLLADVAGDVVTANATLAWQQLETHGEGIPVAGLHAVFAGAPAGSDEDVAHRQVEVVQLPAGGGVRVRTHRTMRLPGMPAPATVAVTQYFVPVPSTEWLAVVTTGTGRMDLAPAIEEVADEMAASLRVAEA